MPVSDLLLANGKDIKFLVFIFSALHRRVCNASERDSVCNAIPKPYIFRVCNAAERDSVCNAIPKNLTSSAFVTRLSENSVCNAIL